MNKEFSELLKLIEPKLENLGKKLDVLAVLNLANEFYSDDERKRLYAQYVELKAADNDAFEVLSHATPTENLGWEKRVEKYGEENATEQMAPLLEAMDKRKDTLKALHTFRDEHGLIVKLVEYKTQFNQ